ncbi:MAG: hypothetical protein NC396_06340 [Bacteroides sp.]|nr:hypothetical protein [Bacteroides sp.]MCM1085975.1 hypothetical protein [Bacteroides sp.]
MNITDMAMTYENLIRDVFKCNRGDRHGANADYFRGLVSASLAQKEDPKGYERRLGRMEVYLSEAFYEICERYQNNKEFVAEIEKIREYLDNPSMKKIDECIEKAAAAFEKIGLFIRY